MQLGWVRYAWTVGSPQGDFAHSVKDALQAGAEKAASSGSYALYRVPVDAAAMQSAWAAQVASAPVVSFRLTQSSAAYLPGNNRPVQGVDVLGGNLLVDFGRSQFATRLELQNPSIGSQQISASGNITPNGLFKGTNGDAIAGGLSGSLFDAGYTFDKELATGHLRGITLWRQ